MLKAHVAGRVGFTVRRTGGLLRPLGLLLGTVARNDRHIVGDTVLKVAHRRLRQAGPRALLAGRAVAAVQRDLVGGNRGALVVGRAPRHVQ